jgi:predicted nucleotidyltransferase
MPANTRVREIVAQMVRRLVDEYQPERVILFGSLAYGEPDEDTDIDLLIVKETPDPPLDRRVRVRRLLTDPKRRIPFSPLVLTPRELAQRLALGDPFYREIVGEGQVMYERS